MCEKRVNACRVRKLASVPKLLEREQREKRAWLHNEEKKCLFLLYDIQLPCSRARELVLVRIPYPDKYESVRVRCRAGKGNNEKHTVAARQCTLFAPS